MEDKELTEEKETPTAKKKSSKKEVLMIVVVVLLAFGLTVAGIVYLTGFLLGEDTNPPKVETPIVPTPPVEEDNILRFDMDNETDNTTITEPEPEPEPIIPIEPVVTPPPPPPPPAPAKVEPTPVAPKPKPTATKLPTSSPTKGAYQLQLFALQNQSRANASALEYLKDYPDVYIMRVDLGAKGVWYRARCCSVNSRAEATAIKAAIEKKYKIVPDIVKGE
jgi:cell division septation protein DedD